MARPLHGIGLFHVIPGTIYYTIVFDYDDEEGEYYELLSRGGRDLEAEEKRLAEEMQREMNSERIIINGKEVRSRVVRAKVGVRETPRRSTATFFIEMPWEPVRGINVYENFYEPDTAPYDYVVYWLLPEGGRFRSYDMPGDVAVEGRLLTARVSAGTRVPGYESLTFELP